jgi:hypothetical protein
MSGPLSRKVLLEGMVAQMAVDLGVDVDEEEMAGVWEMATSALNYLTASVRGAPPGSARPLLWAVCSALWEGVVPQEEVDEFFTAVDLDPGRILHAWRQLRKEGTVPTGATVALIPGKLTETEICDVVRALYLQRRDQRIAPP